MGSRKPCGKEKKKPLRERLGFGKPRRPRRKRSPRWKFDSKHQEALLKKASRSTLNTIPWNTFSRGGREAPPIIPDLVTLIPSRGLLLPKDAIIDHDTDVRIRESMIRSLGYANLNQVGVGKLIRYSFQRAVFLVEMRKTSREQFWKVVASTAWMSPYLDGPTIRAFLLRIIIAFRKGNSHQPNESHMRKAIREFNDHLMKEPPNDELELVMISEKVPSGSKPRTDQAANYILSNLREITSFGGSKATHNTETLEMLTKKALEESRAKTSKRVCVRPAQPPRKRLKSVSGKSKGVISAARGMERSKSGSGMRDIV